MSFPEKFLQTLNREWGEEEARALVEALDTPSPTAIRHHPMKRGVLPVGEPIPWSRWGCYLAERPSFTLDPAFHGGTYYVQEASSQFVGHLLSTEPMEGKRLLDLCAAPGGKTTLYASLVGCEGLVVANEVERRRVQILRDNVAKWGMGNVVVTTNEAKQFEALEGWFDVVAVDAPCSGEGMFRRLRESREEWSEHAVGQCSAIQREILRSAWQALKPGGVLIYSTCTFNRTEDEGVLADFVDWAGEEAFEPMPVEPKADEWGVLVGEVGPFRTYRFFPHRAKGEGFFAAVVRKAADGAAPRSRKPRKGAKLAMQPTTRKECEVLSRWVAEPEKMCYYRAGEMLYTLPASHYENLKLLSEELRVVYAGVAMGEIFKGELKPDGALAFAVALNHEVLPVADLSVEEALDFLRKGDLRAEHFREGLNLVCCNDLPLGFAKRIGGRVNNLYPNSLRIVNK